MALFQQSVLQKHLNDLNKEQLDQAWLLYRQHFFNAEIQQNIRNSKEEEYQDGFVRDLFVDVLGYILNPQPNYNFVLEKKTIADATKSDGAILLNNEVIAVVELKDTGTPDLDKVSTQAFGYKHKHKNCIYVITSNFEKLRFYINDATDYEEFNLFTLTQERFALLYLCLHRQNILANIPLQVKQTSLVQEENVTKKLYADYSLFKRTLFQNISAQNPQHDKLLLFKKTQKLLDRFLFILFAEDRLLVPPNSVREILKQWEQLKDMDNYVPLYERFKKYFGYLNVGHTGKHHEIFAYNGGLFLPDEVLDSIFIDDAILFKGTTTLSNYDYNTEIDVNILGHIFEHSLTEIEELQLELEGKAIEKSKTKRKKEGVFYTPRYITKYIVENTVGALCTQKKEELQINEEAFAPQKRKANRKALLDKIDAYRQWLLQLTICDPACGSGAFLNAALEYLKAEHRTLDELTARVHDAPMVFPEMDNEILEHNLYGVDINEDAIEIAKLSLWLHTAKKGRKLSNLSNNIKVGNSLIDDPAVAGDKAFSWKEEFKSVFDKGGFDVVIGNPPYVDVKNLPEEIKKYLFENYKTTENRINLYSIFIEKGLALLNASGFMSFVNPNSMLINSSYKKLRYLIYEYLRELVKLPDNTFTEAKVETIIFVLKKNNTEKLISILPYKKDEKISSIEENRFIVFDKQHWENDENLNFNFYSSNSENEILNKAEIHSTPLIDICDFSLGLTPYDKYKGHSQEEIDNRVFHSKTKLSDQYKPLITGENIVRYYTSPNIEEYIKYGNWLSRPREERFFINERIIVRQIASGNPPRIYASYANEPYFFTHHGFALILKKGADIQFKFLLALVNSHLINFYHTHKFLDIEKRLFQKVLIENFKRLPIKILPSDQQQPFIAKADIMLEKNKELNQLSEQFTKLLQTKFPNININNKLQQWYSLAATDLFKELSKQKIKLKLPEQQEWLQYFEQQKEKAASIRQTLQQTDKAIDAMVYRLYGLSDEEIAIVEGVNG
ncbi:MAG TPA: N-6 DNA methylase [Chitinophagaceae bacterium]|nr:N-6 DNA methylase [Chitinophagaceae bacterium]